MSAGEKTDTPGDGRAGGPTPDVAGGPAGNLAGAAAAMGGFQGLWEKAGPVIQPLAGDKWGTIDTAAKTVISTFGNGAKPDAAAATSAITGLMGPLKGLVGQ